MLLLAHATITSAGDMFFDEAEVIGAQPVYETRLVETPVQRCGYEWERTSVDADPQLVGDVRATRPHDDLATALRSEGGMRGARQQVYRCHTATATTEESELAGYRVTYRYDGRIYERQVAERPGERIRVRVRISAGEAHLLTRSNQLSNREFDRQAEFAVRRTAW